MLPDLDGEGVLPAGIHWATWLEVEERFGTTGYRRLLLRGAKEALEALRRAGCTTAYLNGSFVTDKSVPGDYDMCWDPRGVTATLLDPVLLDLAPPRLAQHAKYLGDIFPNVTEAGSNSLFVEFFKVNKLTGKAKGIIAIDLRSLT